MSHVGRRGNERPELMWSWNLLCMTKRCKCTRSMSGLGIEGCDREAFESWDCETRANAVLEDKNCPEKARAEVGRIG